MELTVVRTSQFTIQTTSLQLTEKNLHSWRLSAVSHLRFRSSTVMRRPKDSEPKITSTVDSSWPMASLILKYYFSSLGAQRATSRLQTSKIQTCIL